MAATIQANDYAVPLNLAWLNSIRLLSFQSLIFPAQRYCIRSAKNQKVVYRKDGRESVNSSNFDDFFGGIQNRAFRIAQASLRNREDALDAVQDAMYKLVQKYSHKSESEWTPLFYRILYSRITDIQRKRSTSGKLFNVFFSGNSQSEDENSVQQFPDPCDPDPVRYGSDVQFGNDLTQALVGMPERQRQAFMLRAWEGLNVKEAAIAMACSEGSVKTHYSRARQYLQEKLAAYS